MIEGFGKQELRAFVLGAVAPQTQLVTDDWPAYQDLPGVRHNAITLGPMAAHIAVPGTSLRRYLRLLTLVEPPQRSWRVVSARAGSPSHHWPNSPRSPYCGQFPRRRDVNRALSSGEI